MVKGIDKFREFFKDFEDNYILIGGAACDTLLSEAGLTFRATKDLDIILVIEALSSEFVKKFWQFINEGNYETKERSAGLKKYYRFTKPEKENYPFQLELFSRNPYIVLDFDARLTPIPIDADVSSLSAILLDEDYYNFTINHSQLIDNLHLASTYTLICLKAKAYIDLNKQKEDGHNIDSRDIKKHKNDIIRLAAILTSEDITDLPKTLKDDLKIMLEDIYNDQPDARAIAKGLNAAEALNIQAIIDQLKQTFHLT